MASLDQVRKKDNSSKPEDPMIQQDLLDEEMIQLAREHERTNIEAGTEFHLKKPKNPTQAERPDRVEEVINNGLAGSDSDVMSGILGSEDAKQNVSAKQKDSAESLYEESADYRKDIARTIRRSATRLSSFSDVVAEYGQSLENDLPTMTKSDVAEDVNLFSKKQGASLARDAQTYLSALETALPHHSGAEAAKIRANIEVASQFLDSEKNTALISNKLLSRKPIRELAEYAAEAEDADLPVVDGDLNLGEEDSEMHYQQRVSPYAAVAVALMSPLSLAGNAKQEAGFFARQKAAWVKNQLEGAFDTIAENARNIVQRDLDYKNMARTFNNVSDAMRQREALISDAGADAYGARWENKLNGRSPLELSAEELRPLLDKTPGLEQKLSQMRAHEDALQVTANKEFERFDNEYFKSEKGTSSLQERLRQFDLDEINNRPKFADIELQTRLTELQQQPEYEGRSKSEIMEIKLAEERRRLDQVADREGEFHRLKNDAIKANELTQSHEKAMGEALKNHSDSLDKLRKKASAKGLNLEAPAAELNANLAGELEKNNEALEKLRENMQKMAESLKQVASNLLAKVPGLG